MLPRSDEIEQIISRARQLAIDLRHIGQREITQSSLKEALAQLARDWLRISQTLRDQSVCDVSVLSNYDQLLEDVLNSTTIRSRASAVLKKLLPFVEEAMTTIVVPLIQYDGSPRQVAARQVLGMMSSHLSPDEQAYAEEAARCVTVQSYRAAIIMLWCVAIARFHSVIVIRGYDAFNRAIDEIIAKKVPPFTRIKESSKLTSLPELQRSKDSDLIIIGMQLFSYDLQISQELDRLLGIRNDAAHPGMSQPNSLDVLQFASKIDQYILQLIS
jgi:hypothetical protein